MGRVVPLTELGAILTTARVAGKRVVLTNGCFDLLHVGHARLLQQARALGDVLVVGVNGDGSVRRLKGPARPLVPAAERAELVAALGAVDYVAVFEEPTAERLAAAVRPDVYVKGADYATTGGTVDSGRLPEASVVQSGGGQVVLIPLVPDRSTSGLLERIRDAGAGAGGPPPGAGGVP